MVNLPSGQPGQTVQSGVATEQEHATGTVQIRHHNMGGLIVFLRILRMNSDIVMFFLVQVSARFPSSLGACLHDFILPGRDWF